MTRFLAFLVLLLPIALLAEPPKRVLLTCEVLEMDRGQWLRWTADPKNSLTGPELREHLHQLQLSGRATVAELAICASRPALRARADSFDEILFPVPPYDFRVPSRPGQTAIPPAPPLPWTLQPYPSPAGKVGDELIDFELATRNTGMFLEINIGEIPEPRAAYSVNFTASSVQISKMVRRWEGLLATDMPEFAAQTRSELLDLQPGQPRLIGTSRPPRSANGSRKDPISLAFCRLDVVPLPEVTAAEIPERRLSKTSDPFSGERLPAGTGDATLRVEWVEIRPQDLPRLVESDRPRVLTREWEEARLAKVLETTVLSTRIGSLARSKTSREFIYATEYDWPEMTEPEGKIVYPRVPAAFETRDLGFLAAADIRQIEGGGAHVDLSVSHTALLGMRNWGDPKAKLESPDLHTVSAALSVELPWGESRLIATGKLADAPVAIFARVDGPKPAAPVENRSLRYVVQAIETTQSKLSQLLVKKTVPLTGPELWSALAADGEVVTTSLIGGLPGRRVRGFSVDEVMYPTEFDPAITGPDDQILLPFPAAYETRNVGLEVELEANVQGELVSLNLSIADVTMHGLRTHFDPKLAVATPEFHTQRLSQALWLTRDGSPAFLGTTRPRGENDKIRAWFIRVGKL